MSGDDHSPSQAPGGTAANFDHFKALSPPGCVVANWDCVRSTSYVYPNATLTNAQAAALPRRRLRGRAPPARRLLPDDPAHRGRARGVLRHATRAVPGQVHERRPDQVSSRTHCVFWPDWVSNAKVELGRGIRMDANYYHYPGHLDRRQAGLHERRRLPDALRRPRRHADRRLPGEHELDGRVDDGLPDGDRVAARQRGRLAGVLRRVRREHAHRQRPRRIQARRRSSPPRRRGACR